MDTYLVLLGEFLWKVFRTKEVFMTNGMVFHETLATEVSIRITIKSRGGSKCQLFKD